jgi:protein tyrosine/serine phosphatase
MADSPPSRVPPDRFNLASPLGRSAAWLSMHLVDHGVVRTVYNNFYSLGGGLYRCSQPSPAQIRRYHRKLGIRSIINLRGHSPYGSYPLEVEVCRELGINLVDARLFSREPPSAEDVHRMNELFARLEYPALMHCKSGADRAGMGSVLYRVLRLGHDVKSAMVELDWRYGHFRQARTGVLDFFLHTYVDRHEREPIAVLDWVDREYDKSDVQARFKQSRWSSLLVDSVLRRE